LGSCIVAAFIPSPSGRGSQKGATMSARNLLLIALLALLAFGGSFTCTSHEKNSDVTVTTH